MTTTREESELDQLWDEITQLLEDKEQSLKSTKEPVKKKTNDGKKNQVSSTTYQRISRPRVMSVEEYEKRVANGELKNVISHTQNNTQIKNTTISTPIRNKVKPKIKNERTSKIKEESRYKEVQDYEDAKKDVFEKNGWKAFKISLASVALAGIVVLGAYTVNEAKELLEAISPPEKITSLDSTNEQERELIETRADSLRKKVLAQEGYYFDHISEKEFYDGYYRIRNYVNQMNDNQLKWERNDNQDKELLDHIVKQSFEEEYESFSEEKKRDYRQLSFELLLNMQPEKTFWIRNPIILDELSVRRSVLEEKGYKMTLMVNSDEIETVRILGNIKHELYEMEESDLKKFENSQEAFFDTILEKVLGDKHQNLSNTYKEDYKVIIYGWLPEYAKQYIDDPIKIEEIENEQIDDIEIGG